MLIYTLSGSLYNPYELNRISYDLRLTAKLIHVWLIKWFYGEVSRQAATNS